MSKISGSVKKTIDQFKRLSSGGSADDQFKACDELGNKLFPGRKLKNGIDTSVIPELLPTVMKFMESENHSLQKEAVRIVHSITLTPDMKVNTKRIIDAGAIPKLISLLSSTNADVLNNCFKAIVSITFDFPEKIVENGVLPLMIQYLKSENQKILYHAAWFMDNVSYKCEEGVVAISKAGGIEPLIKILESKYNAAYEHALGALTSITFCNTEIFQRVLDLGVLSSLKKLCDRVLIVRKRNTIYGRERKMVNLLAIRFIKHVTSYGEEAQIDMIMGEGFMPLILRQISDGMTPEIKIESIEVIKNIITFKPTFLSTLISEQNLFSFYYSNLGSSNATLVASVLTAMKNIIEASEDKDICRQKIRECGCPTKLRNLFEHANEEVRRLAHLINAFVNGDVKPVLVPARDQESGVIELNDESEDATSVAETPQTRRQPKRHSIVQTADGPVTRSKRSRISNEQADRDNSVISVNDDTYNDFDDHPGSYPSANQMDTVASNAESIRSSSVPTNQSAAIADTVADDFNIVEIDEKKPFIPRKSSPPAGDFGNPSTLLSLNSASTTVALDAESNVDSSIPTNQSAGILDTVEADYFISDIVEIDEKKPLIPRKSSPSDDFDNPSRPSSGNSPVLPEPAAANDDEKFIIETKPSPTRSQPIIIQLPVEITAANAITTNSDPTRQPTTVPSSPLLQPIPDQITPPANVILSSAISFPPVKYWHPYERTIDIYCKLLGIQFDRKEYATFIQKIEFAQITSNSKPATFHSPNDETGFGCFSMLLTGSEDEAETIRMKINKKFVDDLSQSGNFDEAKITHVIAPPFILKAEHFETVADWFNCRMLVYCNGSWKQYGEWNDLEEDDNIPLFVLAKNATKGITHFDIVLTLKNDN